MLYLEWILKEDFVENQIVCPNLIGDFYDMIDVLTTIRRTCSKYQAHIFSIFLSFGFSVFWFEDDREPLLQHGGIIATNSFEPKITASDHIRNCSLYLTKMNDVVGFLSLVATLLSLRCLVMFEDFDPLLFLIPCSIPSTLDTTCATTGGCSPAAATSPTAGERGEVAAVATNVPHTPIADDSSPLSPTPPPNHAPAAKGRGSPAEIYLPGEPARSKNSTRLTKEPPPKGGNAERLQRHLTLAKFNRLQTGGGAPTRSTTNIMNPPPPTNLPISFTEQNPKKTEKNCKGWAGDGFRCFIEWDEWLMVWAFITPRNVVLEFGARYATTSCVLAHFTGNSGSVVAVDPDPTARSSALQNLYTHKCSGVHHVQGTVSSKFGGLFAYHSDPGAGYAGGTKVVEKGKTAGDILVPNFHFSEIEEKIGKKFNTLLIDCEGCITQLFETSGEEDATSLLDNIEVILMEEDKEADVSEQTGYTFYHELFRNQGFVRVWHSHDTFSPWSDEWSRIMRHSSWARPHSELGRELFAKFGGASANVGGGDAAGSTPDVAPSGAGSDIGGAVSPTSYGGGKLDPASENNEICQRFYRAWGFETHAELFCVEEGNALRNPDFPEQFEPLPKMTTQFGGSERRQTTAAAPGRSSLSSSADPRGESRGESALEDKHKVVAEAAGGTGAGLDDTGGDRSASPSAAFTIHVLTWRRATALRNLFQSLQNADYGTNNQIDVVVHLDGGFSADVLKQATQFEKQWQHGGKKIIQYKQNRGLAKSWFDCWEPRDDSERVLILEDDVEVSPFFYLWLKRAWEAYGGNRKAAGQAGGAHGGPVVPDLAGIALQRQTLLPKLTAPGQFKEKHIENNGAPYLFRLVGSIGFSPNPVYWRAFVQWIRRNKLDQIQTLQTPPNVGDPIVDVGIRGLITSDWWRQNSGKGNMWTQHFLWFCSEHAWELRKELLKGGSNSSENSPGPRGGGAHAVKTLYTLYSDLVSGKTLAAHLREAGEHFKSSKGRDFEIAKSRSEVSWEFPETLNRYGWGGEKENYEKVEGGGGT